MPSAVYKKLYAECLGCPFNCSEFSAAEGARQTRTYFTKKQTWLTLKLKLGRPVLGYLPLDINLQVVSRLPPGVEVLELFTAAIYKFSS